MDYANITAHTGHENAFHKEVLQGIGHRQVAFPSNLYDGRAVTSKDIAIIQFGEKFSRALLIDGKSQIKKQYISE